MSPTRERERERVDCLRLERIYVWLSAASARENKTPAAYLETGDDELEGFGDLDLDRNDSKSDLTTTPEVED